MKNKINILNISDLHLGHNNTKTDFIIDNLYSYFTKYTNILKDLDIIIISGDVFERLLPNNSSDYNDAIAWLSTLSKYCKAHSIKLRILEGTPSHDFKQLKSFYTILQKLNIDIDFKYFDKLTIEFITDLNLSVLYIPDEINETAKETYDEVLSLLKENRINKVDLTVMHGQFQYHLPMITTPVSHIEDDYLKITKSFILCGHIHTSSIYDRILVPGSFDRLSQGQEEKKGGFFISLNNGINEYVFLENTHAKIYTTLYLKNDDIDDIIKMISKKKYPTGSEIRIRINKETDLKNSLDILVSKFTHIKIKIEYNDTSDIQKTNRVIYDTDEISITKDNIKKLITKELNNMDIENKYFNILLTELDNVI